MLEQVTTIEKNENFFMFRFDVKDDVNVSVIQAFHSMLYDVKSMQAYSYVD